MSIDLVLDSTNVQSTDNQLAEQADNILSEIEKLTPEEQAMVKSFSEKIDLTNNDIVMNYGNTVQKQSSTVTSKTLQSVRTKDTGSAGQLMVQMACAMNGLEGNDSDSNFIQKICNKVRLSAKGFIVKNENAEKALTRIEKQLDGHRLVLEKDVARLEDLYNENWEIFKALTLYIKAAEIAMEKARNTTLVQLNAKAQETGLPEDATKASDFESQIDEFDKQVQNLRLTRTVCLQTAPQIRMLQRSDMSMARKLKSSIVNTIPLWKNKITMSIMLEDNKKAIEAQNALDDATNRMLKEQAEQFHMAVVESAKASQRGIIDIDTINAVNDEIVSAISDWVDIEEQGRRDRQQAVQILTNSEKQLVSGVLSSAKEAEHLKQ